MTWARRALGPIAFTWLVCQAATFALVPALLEARIEECACPLGADAACPMHHKAPAGARVCAMQSANTGVPATLNSLLSIAGLLPARTATTLPASTIGPVLVEHSHATRGPSAPDPPPPRA